MSYIKKIIKAHEKLIGRKACAKGREEGKRLVNLGTERWPMKLAFLATPGVLGFISSEKPLGATKAD